MSSSYRWDVVMMVLSKCSVLNLIRDGRRYFPWWSFVSTVFTVSFNVGSQRQISFSLSVPQMKNWTDPTSSKGYVLCQIVLFNAFFLFHLTTLTRRNSSGPTCTSWQRFPENNEYDFYPPRFYISISRHIVIEVKLYFVY